MKLAVLLFLSCFFGFITARAQNCGTMNIQHVVDIPSTTTEMTMTMRQDNTGKPYLYVANKEGGLRIYDITILSSPTLVRSVPTSEFGGLDVMNLSQEGNYIYLALGNHFTNPEISGMAIVDVTVPALASVTDHWSMAGDTSGSGIIKVVGDYAYLGAMKNGLIILDIANKSDIKFVSQFIPDLNYPTPNPNPDLYNARGIDIKDDIVYLCFDAGGIRIINTTDKQNPRETGRFSNPLLNGRPRAYNNLVLDDTLLYVAVDYCGVEVLSVDDTSNIKLVGWWNPFDCVGANWFASPVHANEIEYNKTCKQLFTSTGKSDMYVVDVSNPAAPDSCNIYGGVDNQLGTWGVSIHENRIFLSYIFALIPFQSNWTGVKILTYTSCSASVEGAKGNEFTVFPQPAATYVNLVVERPLDISILRIVDMLGAVVNAPCTPKDSIIKIDTSSLSPGLYFVQANTADRSFSMKFLKN
jgi:hypothetical protein